MSASVRPSGIELDARSRDPGPTYPFVAGRQAEASVHPIFLERRSPRAFRPDAIPRETLMGVFEAARWAPSSSNEQPWLFLFATSPEDRGRFLEGLVPWNRRWAEKAPVIVYMLARKTIREGPNAGAPNPLALFDTGAAWMSMALAAQLSGLAAHGMAGIERDRVYELLKIPREKFEVVAAAVIGYPDSPETLPVDLAEREVPSGRRPLREIAVEGGFPEAGSGSTPSSGLG